MDKCPRLRRSSSRTGGQDHLRFGLVLRLQRRSLGDFPSDQRNRRRRIAGPGVEPPSAIRGARASAAPARLSRGQLTQSPVMNRPSITFGAAH
jgi:hypothetical protein